MRFLRMLTNSLLAGALGAAFLTIIVLQLNPNVPLVSGTTWRLFVTLGALLRRSPRGAVLSADGRRASSSASTPLSPGWVSVRVLAWLAAASSAVASVLMWLNVSGFSAALGETAARRMTAGAAATTATAIVLLGPGGAHYSFGRRGSRVGAGLLAIAVFGSLALPIAARGPGVADARRTARDDDGADAAHAGIGPACRHAAARRRVARIHLAARSRRSAAELRAAPRDRRVDGSGDGPADRSGSGVGGGRHRHVSRQERRAVAVCLLRARRHAGRSPSCPTIASRTCSSISGFCAAKPNSSAIAARAAALEHPGRRRHHRRHRPLAADVSGAAGSRFRAERPLSIKLLGSFLELDESAAYPADVLPVARSAFADAGHTPDWLPSPVALENGTASPEASAGLRDQFYSRAMRDLRAAVARAVVGGALPGARHRRPLQPALHAAARRCGGAARTNAAVASR